METSSLKHVLIAVLMLDLPSMSVSIEGTRGNLPSYCTVLPSLTKHLRFFLISYIYFSQRFVAFCFRPSYLELNREYYAAGAHYFRAGQPACARAAPAGLDHGHLPRQGRRGPRKDRSSG